MELRTSEVIYGGVVIDGTDVIWIHQLLGRYGWAIDGGDWDAFAELFVADATINYRSSSGRVERAGREAIVDWFRSVADRNPAAHHVTNIVVDPGADPDGPVAVQSKFFAPYSRDAHNPKRLYGGDYRDVVVRTPDGWRFASKECIPRWQLTVQTDESGPERRRTY